MIDNKNIILLGHSSIKIIDKAVMYIDPYNISCCDNDADFIFITHSHYDHFSAVDIKKCMKNDTKIIITKDLYNDCLELGFDNEHILVVDPCKNYDLDNISFETIPAYNINKIFHKKENGWVGYLIKINSIKYYVTGDTDINEENKKVKCDILFIPIGGVYTMNYVEASQLANEINPKYVYPIHYGVIVGSKSDALEFKKLLSNNIRINL